MKILDRQIKFAKIGKYIKKNDLRWLLFLLVPLVIGLIVHFTVPLLFVLNANPTAQSSYNRRKIEVELNTVRSLSILNSQIIQLKMQITQNLRNFLVKIFGQSNRYQNISISKISLNNGFQFANQVLSGINVTNIVNQSMWFVQGKSTLSQLNQVQSFLYSQYVNVEPYIRTQFSKFQQFQILKKITVSANFYGQGIYFQYPSQFKQQFLQIQSSCFDKFYNQTMLNYIQSNGSFQYRVFTEKTSSMTNDLIICNIIFDTDNITAVGVACFHIDLRNIAAQMTGSLSIPNVSYSSTNYFLLTPIYSNLDTSNTSLPQIIFNFTDKNPKAINFPTNSYFSVPSTFSRNLYQPTTTKKVDYSYRISFQTSSLVYIQVPINIYSYKQQEQTILFLLVQYNFQSSVFDLATKYSLVLRDLSIPSVIVIFVSTIISLIILRYLLNQVDDQLFKINQKCQFLLRGDIQLKISESQSTQQLKSVFKNMKMVNYLHKFSSYQYFNIPEDKKIVNLFKVLQIFKQLQYPCDFVYENIGDCYLMLNKTQRSIQFLQKSYQHILSQIQSIFGYSLPQILDFKYKQNKPFSKKYRSYEIRLIGRLYKIISAYNIHLFQPNKNSLSSKHSLLHKNSLKLFNFQIQDKQNTKISKKYLRNINKLKIYIDTFKKLVYPNFITSETIFAYLVQAKVQIFNKNFKTVKTILKRFQKVLTQCEHQFQSIQSTSQLDSPTKHSHQLKNNLSLYCRISSNVLWSHFYLIQAQYLTLISTKGQNLTQIVDLYEKAISKNHIYDDIHYQVAISLIQLLTSYKISTQLTKKLMYSFTFFKQLNPGKTQQKNSSITIPLLVQNGVKSLQKQVLFVFDCSNKWIINLDQFRKWQKHTRQTAIQIFNLLLPDDRASIVKINSNVYVQTCCNLIYKHHNQSLILKQLNHSVKLKFMAGKCHILKGIHLLINRIKGLTQEKYLILFLKEQKQEITRKQNKMQKQVQIDHQPKQKNKRMKKVSSSSNQLLPVKGHNFGNNSKKRKNTQFSPKHKISFQSNNESQGNFFDQQYQNDQLSTQFFNYYKNLKQQLLNILLDLQLFNLRLMIIVQNSDNFKRRFDLNSINQTLNQQFMKRKINNNNLLYVCDHHINEDYTRIFQNKSKKPNENTILNMF